jgi:hypothetical protein
LSRIQGELIRAFAGAATTQHGRSDSRIAV